MTKILGLMAVMLLVASSVFAQKADDSKAALAVVNQLWAEMAAANPAGIVALHNPGAQLVALFKTQRSETGVRNLSAEDFSKGFSEKKNLKGVCFRARSGQWRPCACMGPVCFLCRGEDLALRVKCISSRPHRRGMEDRRHRLDHRPRRMHRGGEDAKDDPGGRTRQNELKVILKE